VPTPAAEPTAAPAPEPAASDVKRDDKSDEKPAGRARTSGRGGSNRGNGNDKSVVGMGDHLPGFIAQSFDDRRG